MGRKRPCRGKSTKVVSVREVRLGWVNTQPIEVGLDT
jgi:hypothetical protein